MSERRRPIQTVSALDVARVQVEWSAAPYPQGPRVELSDGANMILVEGTIADLIAFTARFRDAVVALSEAMANPTKGG